MSGLWALDDTIVPAIDGAPMLEHVLSWASINTGTRNLAGLEQMARLLVDAFSALPGAADLVEPAPVQVIDHAGTTIDVTAGKHLVLRVRPDAERRVLLTGHMDTVFGADDAFQHCEWLDDRNLRGPGVLDMKSGLAIMLAGLSAYEALEPTLGYDVLINSDEETGSASSSTLIAEMSRGKIAALTYEPSLPGGFIARSRPGSGNYAALVRGKAAHAGRNPEDGRNAIVAAGDLALRLYKARHSGLSVNPAKIDGGGPNNVVPPLAIVHFNLRPREREDMAAVPELVERLAAEVSADHDVAIDMHGGIGRPAKPVEAGTEQLFRLVSEASAALGDPLEWRDVGGVCDGNNIAACGVPVIDTMGACGDFIHSPREFLDTASLVPKAKLTALVLHRLDKGHAWQ